jgi:Ser-tRNA(Ala) deacylase AlaX
MKLLPCQEDAYLRSLDVDVLECAPTGDVFEAVLSATPLYPEGGGQPSDGGTVGGFAVLALSRRDDGAVVHRLAAPVAGRVTVEVDWPRRYDHMQQHTAQHLLTATALAGPGWRTVAFHLGPERSDIDMDAEDLPGPALAALEADVNARIRAALPVRTRLAGREEFERLGVRSRLLPEGIEGPFRLVEIEGVDLNTCGGTHVASTAELQAIKLVGTERVARGTRLHFVAGGRVLREIDHAVERDRALTRVLTCGRDEHLGSIERTIAERRDLERQVHELKSERAAFIGRDLASSAASEAVVAWHTPAPDAEVLRAVAFAAREARPDLLVLAAGGGTEGLVLLAGPEPRVAAAWPVVCSLLAARGGGRDGVRQGKATRLDRVEDVLQTLRDRP